MKRGILLICAVGMIVLAFFKFAYTDKTVEDKKKQDQEKTLFAQTLEKTKGRKFLSDLAIKKKDYLGQAYLNDLNYKVDFYLNNKKLVFNKPIKNKFNRYYFSLNDFAKTLGVNYKQRKNNIIFENKVKLDLDNNIYGIKDNRYSLRGEIIKSEDDIYISFFDLCDILNLRTHWDYGKGSIIINKIKKEIKRDTYKNEENKELKNSYIRFEDFAPGNVYDEGLTAEEKSGLNADEIKKLDAKSSGVNLEKMRVVADYMYSKCETFHIALVSRYVNPELGIDNDIARDNNIKNANFLFTIDYLINRNGIVGLHGYTHQYGNAESIIGSEFGKNGYNKESDIRLRVEAAIENAVKLNIPYKFWETPHYRTTKEQQAIFEEYFNYLYEPCIGVYNTEIIESKRNKLTKYIPTPLSYVKDLNVEEMKKSMQNKKSNEIMSLYYHASKEATNYIEVSIDKENNINYKYNENSVLKKLVNFIQEKGYKFNSIES
ncbi:hypothetical protein SAMN02745163_00506 [Clostridium cavendishii DSM 21758]|uniref:Copper amine oxidase N-terminal domain-containing protein n=1 Tax=Clostridium cavendishii DSM 21758 TaxID=1121302 RepID=A0A1M6CNG5_9CLOT|nr:DUF2334 domain-containing protein [Clostridium cavendishii]SHI62334.1 hypothetical protein SAMN02745163_00506 [Clostridium cavendishii DSM 21758]